MSDCFFNEKTLITSNLNNKQENNNDINLFNQFYSNENKDNLIHITSRLQNDYGAFSSISELNKLINDLLIKFKPHLLFMSYEVITLRCDYLTALDYINKEFIKMYFNTIIKNDKTNDNIISLVKTDSKNNQQFTITKPIGTTYNADGEVIYKNMDTQDMTVDDWRNMDVFDDKPTFVSSNNFRNGNKIPWRQKQGQIRNYERDIDETLPRVDNPETFTYRAMGFSTNFTSQ